MNLDLTQSPEFELTVDNYAIEKHPATGKKDAHDENLHRFVYHSFYGDYEDKKSAGINKLIQYHRNIFGSRRGKNYIGVPDQEDYSEDCGNDELGHIRRLTTRMVNRKLQKLAAIVMDNRPTVSITIDNFNTEDDQQLQEKLLRFGGKEGLTSLLSRLYDDWWDRAAGDSINYKIFLAAFIDSINLPVTYWDENRFHGDGDVVLDYIDPMNFVPESGRKTIDEMSRYFVLRRLDPRNAAREFGEDIIDEAGASEHDESDHKKNIRKNSGVDDIWIIDSIWEDTTCIYIDMQSNEKISKQEYERIKDDPNIFVEVEKIPLYPYGRRICFTSKKVYVDEPVSDPFRPIEAYVPMPDPHTFWGLPMAMMVAPYQEAYDKILQMGMDNFERIGNAWLLIKENALADDDTSLPAGIASQVIKVANNVNLADSIHVVTAQTISSDAWKWMEMLEKQSDDATSIHDASEGKQPGSMQSGRAFLALQEATNRVLRIVAKMYENVLQKIATKAVYLIYMNYEAGRKYSYMVDGHRQTEVLPLALNEIEMTIDVNVQPGSSLPKDKQSQADLALTLFEMGLISPNSLLEKLEWPGEMMDKIQEYETMKQEAMGQISEALQSQDQQKQQQVQQTYHPDIIDAAVRDLQQQMQTQQQVGPEQQRQAQPPSGMGGY